MRALTIGLFFMWAPSLVGAAKVAVLATELEGRAKDEVPSLIDDYVLTAVQDLGGHEVIGPDDVSAVIGFEKEKELLGCDDVACMAEIAGALGVDKIVVFKVARMDDDWATSAKLIDIRDTRVEARTSDFIAGSARDLLSALPGLMAKLFEGDGSAGTTRAVSEPPVAEPVAEAEPEMSGALSPLEEDESVTAQPWFWVTVAGVAVAVAVTVGVLVASSGSDAEARTTVPTSGGALLSW